MIEVSLICAQCGKKKEFVCGDNREAVAQALKRHQFLLIPTISGRSDCYCLDCVTFNASETLYAAVGTYGDEEE